jgi:hypothetical protein
VQDLQDTFLDLISSGSCRGLFAKTLLPPQIEQRAGRDLPPAALVAKGASDLGHEGQGQEGENEEESTGNSKWHSPTGKTAGSSSNLATDGRLRPADSVPDGVLHRWSSGDGKGAAELRHDLLSLAAGMACSNQRSQQRIAWRPASSAGCSTGRRSGGAGAGARVH